MQWDYSCVTAIPGKKPRDTTDELVEPWLARRNAILSKYTTSEKLSIVTSFLSGGEKGIYFYIIVRIHVIICIRFCNIVIYNIYI